MIRRRLTPVPEWTDPEATALRRIVDGTRATPPHRGSAFWWGVGVGLCIVLLVALLT